MYTSETLNVLLKILCTFYRNPQHQDITIPCLYEAKYRDNVKYLCKGYTWASCSYEIKTNTPQNSQIYSISDDKTQTIFTVTIKELADKNTYYWCIVEIDGGGDVGERFYLSGTTGKTILCPPSLYVDNQTVIGFIGENITINCHYTISGAMKWCKLNSNCVTGTSGSIDGTRITLNTSMKNVFSVTLSGLSPESSGWYYCVKGNFQMPVHLTVTEKPTGKRLQTFGVYYLKL
uniref:Immunoglobulin domain-containing protein n=1 Tax=Kryptolebias marmoratus TaxID=37003 RepID=A0A3Q3B8W5_KRYMA